MVIPKDAKETGEYGQLASRGTAAPTGVVIITLLLEAGQEGEHPGWRQQRGGRHITGFENGKLSEVNDERMD